MSNGVASLPRDILTRALGNDSRAVRAFEEEARNNAATATKLAANTDATDNINDATVIVLSPNAAFNNERVLKLGDGLSAYDDGTYLTIYADDGVPHVDGGFAVKLTTTQDTYLQLPTRGLVATVDQSETFYSKTLQAPVLTGVNEYASDAAAAAGGVPINGVYTTSGALKLRRT